MPFDAAEEERRPWRWRNLRHVEIAIYIVPCPWDWFVRFRKSDDDHAGGAYGMLWSTQMGPLCIGLHVTPGNCSTPGWRGRFGLSEEEAWKRSAPAHSRFIRFLAILCAGATWALAFWLLVTVAFLVF